LANDDHLPNVDNLTELAAVVALDPRPSRQLRVEPFLVALSLQLGEVLRLAAVGAGDGADRTLDGSDRPGHQRADLARVNRDAW